MSTWAPATAVIIALSAVSCSPPPLSETAQEDGYTVIKTVFVGDSIRLTLSAPVDDAEARRGMYEAISIKALTDERHLSEFDDDFDNPLGVVFEIGPDGLEFEMPLRVHLTWSNKHSIPTDKTPPRLITRSGRELHWEPLARSKVDTSTRTATAQIDHFSLFALGIPPAPLDSLSITKAEPPFNQLTLQADTQLIDTLALCSTCESVHKSGGEIRVDALPGVHTLQIWAGNYIAWKQDLYVPPNVPYDTWRAYAQKYQPRLHFSKGRRLVNGEVSCGEEFLDEDSVEEYRPQSLESIFHPNIDLGLWEGHELQVASGDTTALSMSSHAHTANVLDQQSSYQGLAQRAGLGLSPVVYWSLSLSEETSRAFITYWMFYPWDWKSPDLRPGRHSLDRESISIELSCESPSDPASCTPEAVWYAGHLEGQFMYWLSPVDGKSVSGRWHGDGLRVPWSVTERDAENPSCPMVYVAQGSHANYPRPSVYYVDPNLDKLPFATSVGDPPSAIGGGIEASCGDADTYGPLGSGTDIEYTLQDLDMRGVTSGAGALSVLLFSGATVDGIVNGRFPPFLRRFHDTDGWALEQSEGDEVSEWCPEAECLDCPFMHTNSYCIGDVKIECHDGESSRIMCSDLGLQCVAGECSSDMDTAGTGTETDGDEDEGTGTTGTGTTGADTEGSTTITTDSDTTSTTGDEGCTPWAVQLGGSGDEGMGLMSASSESDLYIAGYTMEGIDEPSNGKSDIFVAKLEPKGELVWIDQFGSASSEGVDGITVDDGGRIYIAGQTGGSLDGNTSSGSVDYYVSRYNSDGLRLWTRQHGSPKTDWGRAISVGEGGEVFVGGHTGGDLDGKQNMGSYDMFVSRFTPGGVRLTTTLVGSEGLEHVSGSTVDASGNFYLTGRTNGLLWGAVKGSNDAFVAKFGPDGTFAWISLLGGSNAEDGHSIATGADGSVFVGGGTLGAIYGNQNAGFWDAFVARMSADGTLIWLTQFGSDSNDMVNALSIRDNGDIVAAGYSRGAIDGVESNGLNDALVAVLSDDGNLQWISQEGGGSDDSAMGVAATESGLFIAGYTSGEFSEGPSLGGKDVFVARVCAP